MTSDVQQQLLRGLQILGIETGRSKALMNYLNLLCKWNKAYNLTAIRDLSQMVSKHLLDSLAIRPYLHGNRLIDIGSGAGLPGIPLALVCPERQFVLLDSNGKKTRFMQAAKRELAISNIEIVHSRVESYHPEQTFDTVMSRAFTDLGQMVKLSSHLLNDQGLWLAMKGRVPEEELRQLDCTWVTHSYQVPSIDAERCVILINHH